MPIRVLLADDHTILRRGLRLLLERESDLAVVAEAANGREVIDAVARDAPHVVIMDIAMPAMNGIEATRRISADHPDTAIVILSVHADESYILRALKVCARGYLLKDSAESDLIQAIRAVAAGKAYLVPLSARFWRKITFGKYESRG